MEHVETAPRTREVAILAGTPTKVANYSSSRKQLTLSNAADTPVWYSTRPTVSTTTGIKVGGGGTLSMNYLEDYILPTLEWWVYAESETTILVIEAAETFGGAKLGDGDQ